MKKKIKNKKMQRVKEKENSSIFSGFLLEFLWVSFQCGVSHQCPMGSTY